MRVELGLAPSWHFSALYPVAPVETAKDGATATAWTVDVARDGTLVDKRSGLSVSSLFWEAEATSATPPCALPFDPAHPRLDPSNAVAMPYAEVLAYLDRALDSLGLNVEQRTTMITYWLPALLRHQHRDVALRFLPQADIEAAAPLTVTPKPATTSRVFLLFGGANADDASWQPARERAATVDWASVTGLIGRRRSIGGHGWSAWSGEACRCSWRRSVVHLCTCPRVRSSTRLSLRCLWLTQIHLLTCRR